MNIILIKYHQIFIIKRLFRLVIYKIDCFLCNCFLSSKVLYSNQNPKLFFFNFYFEFLNTHIGHFTKLPMITMALKWHHENIFNKITILKKIWQSFDIVFCSFDYDHTQMALRLVLPQCKDDGVFVNLKKGSQILKCKNFLPHWKIFINLVSNNG